MAHTKFRRKATLLALAGGLALAGAALSACSPVRGDHGYILDPQDLDRIHPGQTSKTEVQGIMGSPSAVAAIKVEGDTWYYITSKFETMAFFPPEEVDRKVVAIYFDAGDTVEEIANYGLEDGQIVNFVDRKTPTLGKKLTLLGQIFGNLGRFNKNRPQERAQTPGR